jgi:hypothetical protein
VGAPYIALGRSEEINALADDLEEIAEGGSKTRLIIGKYGSGKSFLLQLLRGYALERGFVCADCDLSPERRICGRAGTGLATYKELMKNIATRTSPDGNGLAGIISKWLDSLASSLAAEGFLPDTPAFEAELTKRVYAVAGAMEGQVGGFDFARVLLLYHRAGHDLDDNKKSCCLRWLRGEYTTKTEARRDLGVGSIIDDDSWFDFIKLFAVFVRQIGYKGLLVFIDECVNLYKIANRISREANYEKLLSIFNDTLQGRAKHLGVIFGGTPQFLEDTRRGLFSYEALRSRLADGRFSELGYQNLSAPVIRLRRLSDNELLALIRRLTILWTQREGIEAPIQPQETEVFLRSALGRAGAEEMVTPREIIRDYLSLLAILRDHPEATFAEMLAKENGAPEKESPAKGTPLPGANETTKRTVSVFDLDL